MFIFCQLHLASVVVTCKCVFGYKTLVVDACVCCLSCLTFVHRKTLATHSPSTPVQPGTPKARVTAAALHSHKRYVSPFLPLSPTTVRLFFHISTFFIVFKEVFWVFRKNSSMNYLRVFEFWGKCLKARYHCTCHKIKGHWTASWWTFPMTYTNGIECFVTEVISVQDGEVRYWCLILWKNVFWVFVTGK